MKEEHIEVTHFYYGPGKGGAYRVTHTPTGKFRERRTTHESSHNLVARLRKELADIVCPDNVTLNPTWLTPTVKQLASVIYEERQWDKMPILGDLLEEAGCSNEDVLKHCRGGGEHVRGCWVVDQVLGKE